MMDVTVLAAEEGPSPVLPHVEEVVIGLIAFALLLFVLWRYAYPKFEQVYQERTELIEGGIARAEEAQRKANELLEEYRAQLAEARTEAARIRDDARADAEAIRQEVMAQAREEADRIIAAGREALATERERLLQELRSHVGELAVELAGRIIGEALAEEARRNRTVERFLEELETGGEATGQTAAKAGAR